MALKITACSSFDQPGLAEVWDRLVAATPRVAVFSTYEWCRCWAETVGRHARVAILLVEDEQRGVVGLLPACIDQVAGVNWLKFLGREGVSGDHLDLLGAPPDQEDCLRRITEYIAASQDIDGLMLGELETESPTVRYLLRWAQEGGYPVQQREPQVLPYIDLPGSFEDYVASRSAKMRVDIRRSRRKMEQLAGAELRVLRGAEEVNQGLSDLFRLHEERWRAAGQSGNFRNPEKREFLRRFCRLGCRRDWVRCHVLDLSARRQAVLLAFRWAGALGFYQIGWDPDGPLHSPGVVLIAESIAQAIRERLHKYDFLRGGEDYKWRWTSQSVSALTLAIGCRKPARAAMAVEGLVDGVKGAVRRTIGPSNWQRVKRTLAGWAR